MNKIYANKCDAICLGRQGENLATQVIFDLSDWIFGYGIGTAELIAQRAGDEKPYPVSTDRQGNQMIWAVSDFDTESATSYGRSGRCELRYYVGDILVKSRTWQTTVSKAMDTPSSTRPPAADQGWVEQVLATGAAAKASADAAKADADRAAALAAQAAEKAAQTAQDASDAAKAMEAAQTAQRLAEEAQGAAETARTAAAAAQAAAETAATDAAGAKQAAEAALKATQDAAAAAAKALADIRALYQEMQTWAQGVIQTVNSAADSAGQSATNAAGSASAASKAQSAAETAQRGAEDAKTKAEASKEASAKSETAAKLSEQNAKTSEDAAKASESNAAGSASAAADSATAAQTAQSGAEAAQSAARQSATSAAESAAVYGDVVADVNQLKQDVAAITPDDTTVDGKPWTSKKIVDSLCQPIEESGNPVQCYPVENYPLGVKVHIEPTQEGSGNPSPDNIRPITGRDAVSVTRCGKNLLNLSPDNVEDGIYQDGEKADGMAGQQRIKTPIRVKPNQKIRYSTDESLKYNVRGTFFDDAGLFVTSVSIVANTVISVPENAYELYVHSNIQGLIGPDSPWFMITADESANDIIYEPYRGNTYDIALPETVYGGEVDAVSGLVTVEYGHTASYAGEPLPGEWLSDRDVYAPDATPTTGAQVVYKLAEPITRQLTPQQIAVLSGVNTIYTDADGVIVTGAEDPKHTITELKNAIISLGGNI